MGKTNLNVDRLLAALSVILSERTGLDVTVRKGEPNNDIKRVSYDGGSIGARAFRL